MSSRSTAGSMLGRRCPWVMNRVAGGDRTVKAHPCQAVSMTDRPSGNRLFAAIYDPVTAVAERALFATHREYLADGLAGRVLDLGAGTGAMFPPLSDAAERADLAVHAVEPDPHMRRRARRRAVDLGLDVRIVGADAARLPYRDGAFDAVLASLVLCTVGDLAATLDEAARVLAPGGELRVYEHVHGEGWYGRAQEIATPAWRVAAAGCHLDRDTDDRLRAHDRFEVVELDQLTPPVPPVTPFVRGRLRLRGG